MAAAKHNFVIEQGATFRKVIKWLDPDGAPVPLTGYSARMQVRNRSGNIMFDLTSEINNGITIDAFTGEITIYISPTQSSDVDDKEGFYDLELEDMAGDVVRLIEGAVTIKSEVTR